MNDKISKVAICENCGAFVKACHVDYLKVTKADKDFTRLSNEGFLVKIETAEETKAREWKFGEEYEECKSGKCIKQQ